MSEDRSVTSPAPSAVSRRGRTLSLWLIISGGLLLVAIAAVYVVLVYLPNRPENVYRRGLGSVAVGMQRFGESGFLDNLKTTTYDGQLIISMPGMFDSVEPSALASSAERRAFSDCVGRQAGPEGDSLTFALNGQFNFLEEEQILQNSFLNLDISTNEKDVFGAEARVLAGGNGQLLPVIYFNVDKTDCLKSLLEFYQEEEGGTGIEEDWLGVWWKFDFQEMIDGNFIDTEDFEDQWTEIEDQLRDLGYTQEDYEEVIDIVVEALQAWVFTSESEKMVFQMNELLDNRADYEGTISKRYSTTINRSNMIAMIKEIRDGLMDSQIYGKTVDGLGLSREQRRELEQELKDDQAIEEFVDDFIENTEVEIWIDSQTKVLRNIRYINKNRFSNDLGSYLDVGLTIGDEAKSVAIHGRYTSFYSSDCWDDYYDIRYPESYNSGEPTDTGSGGGECPYTFEVLECDQPANREDCLKGHKNYSAIYEESEEIGYEGDEESSSLRGRDECEIQDSYEEYRKCLEGRIEKVIVRTLDPGAEPAYVVDSMHKTNFETGEYEFEFRYERFADELVVKVLLKSSSSKEPVTVEAPAESRSLLDYFRQEHEKDKQAMKEYVQSIMNGLASHKTVNDGRLPADESEFETDVLSNIETSSGRRYRVDYFVPADESGEEDEASEEEGSETWPFEDGTYIFEDDFSYYQDIWLNEIHVWAGYTCGDFDLTEEIAAYFSPEEPPAAGSSNYALIYYQPNFVWSNYSGDLVCVDGS